jgi:plastocyanin
MNRYAFLLAAAVLAPLPFVTATPLACADPCDVPGHSLGYRPPAVEIANGTRVLFTAVDIGHLTVEQNTLSSDPSCFAATASPTLPPEPVRFDILGDTVIATTNPGTASETAAVCANAEQLFDGAWAVPFVCVFHPVLMKGSLVITA